MSKRCFSAMLPTGKFAMGSRMASSRRIERQLSGGDTLAQFALQHLAGCVARQCRDVAHEFRLLVARDAFLAEGDEIAGADARSLAQRNHRHDALAPFGIWRADDSGFEHALVLV